MGLHIAATHAYRGCRIRADGPLVAGDLIVGFADGAEAPATLTLTDEGPVLAIAAYTTGQGTAIAAKRWRLAADGDAWKIVDRVG